MGDAKRFVVCGSMALAVMALGMTLVAAQEAPKPGPEHQKLGYFVGEWISEGEVKDNPMQMPTGKMTGKDSCSWFPGNFAVVCKTEGNGPMGPMKGLGILGYSADAQAYTYYGTESTGMAMTTIPMGKVDGKTWTYTDESEMGGMTIKSRYVLVELTPTSYTFKWELLGEDGKWMTVMEGTNKKS